MTGPTPRSRWILPTPVSLDPAFVAAGTERGLSPRALGILAGRGHRDAGALRALFDAPEASLHDPRLLPGAEASLERIARARSTGERILVFGDFDADGLTGLAILVRALRSLGLDVAPHVPDRLGEGHGLSLVAVERAVAERRSLIVTVDCGTSSVAEITEARRRGIDVLVTDHHRPPPELPPAVAIVNPHVPGSTYPHPGLSGSGVAFKVAQLLLDAAGAPPHHAIELADLAAIGAVADLVPLVGENRAIVRLGLERLRTQPRPAIAALLREAGIPPERADVDVIGFAIAPRLNAVGRVGEAAVAAHLLLADDPEEADRHAAALQAANLTRRELTSAALAEARTLAAEESSSQAALVLLGDWPVGVIGLVAGRLSDDLGRPVVVVTRASAPWRGSARSPLGFDLAAAFQACTDLLDRHGGHAAAAGCNVTPDRFEAFRDRFLALAAGFDGADARAGLRLDLVIEANGLDYGLYRELLPLDGIGEAPPVVGIHGLVATRVRAANGGHLQVTLRRGREVFDGICFGRAEELAERVAEGQLLDVAARISSRVFGGFESLQLEIRDLAPPGTLSSQAVAA